MICHISSSLGVSHWITKGMNLVTLPSENSARNEITIFLVQLFCTHPDDKLPFRISVYFLQREDNLV